MELLQKLKINPDKTVWILEGPMDIPDLFTAADIRRKFGKKGVVGQLMLFATDSQTPKQYLPVISGYVGHDTLFWICYPKKTGSIQSDLILMETWEIVFSAGYRAQTSVSINADWTGMRFTNAPRKKPSKAELSMEERKTEGIDYVNRTTVLPEDAVAALKKHKGLVAFFDSMSFSRKREYIEAIADAKKPETRARRIEKMTEAVLKMMTEKELKTMAKSKR